jgi:hypothetical protein
MTMHELERKISKSEERYSQWNSLSTPRDLKVSSSSSVTLVIDPSLNSLALQVMRLLLLRELLAGEPEMLT